jgi:hypothetical protein
MATQKTIKFIKAWQLHTVGAEITVNAPIADLLIANGRAEEVKNEKTKAKLEPKKK